MANTDETITLPVAASGDVPGKLYTASEIALALPSLEMDRLTRLRVGLMNAGATLASGQPIRTERDAIRYMLQQLT
jgi:hypothetical protein